MSESALQLAYDRIEELELKLESANDRIEELELKLESANERIKRLEEAGDNLEYASVIAQREWNKAKEAKP